MFRRIVGVLVTFIVLSAIGAAQGSQQQQQATTAPPPPEAPKPPSSVSPDATGLPIDPKTYVIGPEDILSIKVWREPDFTGAKGVRPDGKITMPLIGDLQAAGLTPQRLADQLTQAISEYVKTPQITVEVIQVNSKSTPLPDRLAIRPGIRWCFRRRSLRPLTTRRISRSFRQSKENRHSARGWKNASVF